MNREIRRKLSQNGEIEKIVARAVDECMDEVREATRHDAYRNAFAAMLLACYKVAFFDYIMIHKVAAETLRYINDTECATELVGMLKDATGFDVDAPLDEHMEGMEVE